ncbi:MAG: hypothetical protein JRH20_05585 [Deltaproteobacteria bacterium]|nr:hypothetical protein [Deltaproteobacteria bacterium]
MALLLRTQIGATSEDGQRAELFVELGQLYVAPLADSRHAEANFRRAIEISPYNSEALIALGNLYEEQSQWKGAVEMLRRAEMLLADASARAEVQRRLGRVHCQLHELQPAQEALQRAADATPSPPLDLLRELADVAKEREDGATEATVRALLADRVDGEEERKTLRRRVAILAEESLDDDDRAVTSWQQLLTLDPLDLQATERLAAIYGRIGHRAAADQHLHAAVSHHRAELTRAPFQTRLYKQLTAIFRWQRAFDPLYCAYITLSQLSGIGESELTFLRNYGERCNAQLPPSLTPEQYDRLLLPRAARGPLRELWHRASSVLLKTLAVPPGQLGLRRGDRIAAKHPLHTEVKRIAEVLQIPTADLWCLPKAPDAVVAAMLTKPVLLVSNEVVDRAKSLSPHDRFRIGHGLMELAEGAILLRGRPVKTIQAFVLALGVVTQQPLDLRGAEASDEDVQQEKERISQALGRRERRKLGEVLADLAQSLGQGDLADQTSALGSAAYRGGLVVSGDPLSALRAALDMEEDRRSKQLADLLLYLIGDDYLRLRVELGIAPQEKL